MKGIDVSNYQGNIDFSKVKASGVQIVYIKATEGKTYQDPCFKTNYNGAKAAGLLVGAYHFLRNNAVVDEVNNFLSVVGNLDFDCKLAIDAETDLGGIDVNSKHVLDFYNALKTKGKDAILYSGECFYNSNLNSSVKNIPVWVAKYSTVKPNVSYIGWQYSSSGAVSGIAGNVDMDDFSDCILIKKYPGYLVKYNLKVCDNNVKLIQQKLGIAADGVFGIKTLSAVQKFQKDKGLQQDGIVGQLTWNKLFN